MIDRRLGMPLLLLCSAACLACGEGELGYGGSPDAGDAEERTTPLSAGTSPEAPGASFQAFAEDAAPGAVPDAVQDPADSVSPLLIRTGAATVEVDSLEEAMEGLRALVEAGAGYVGNVSISGGEAGHRAATLELKVPADGFDALVAGLDSLGVVETVDVRVEDVGEEFVDVQARLANSRRLEARLLAILDRPGSDLADILAVERELARVREGAERLEGRLRYLRSRAALATLSVTLREPESLLGTRPGAQPIRDAFRDALRNLVEVTAFLIAALGVILPLGIAFTLLVLSALWLRSRFGRNR